MTGPQYKQNQERARSVSQQPPVHPLSWSLSDRTASYIPTPEEIEAATASIRETWSEREAISRLASSQRPVPADVVKQPGGYKHNGIDIVI